MPMLLNKPKLYMTFRSAFLVLGEWWFLTRRLLFASNINGDSTLWAKYNNQGTNQNS